MQIKFVAVEPKWLKMQPPPQPASKYKPEWWWWYIVAIPITYLFLKGTYYGVTAFDGDLWPNRFIGFILGIISYAALTAYFFKQPVTGKIFVQLILCFLIVLVQVMWKEKTQ